MTLWELESEAAFLFQRVLNGLDVVGPGDVVTKEGVVDGVVGCDGEGNEIG